MATFYKAKRDFSVVVDLKDPKPMPFITKRWAEEILKAKIKKHPTGDWNIFEYAKGDVSSFSEFDNRFIQYLLHKDCIKLNNLTIQG